MNFIQLLIQQNQWSLFTPQVAFGLQCGDIKSSTQKLVRQILVRKFSCRTCWATCWGNASVGNHQRETSTELNPRLIQKTSCSMQRLRVCAEVVGEDPGEFVFGASMCLSISMDNIPPGALASVQ